MLIKLKQCDGCISMGKEGGKWIGFVNRNYLFTPGPSHDQ